MNPILLTCKKASIGYRGRNGQTLITEFDFDLHAGEVVGLIGRNGVGKSSLLRSLAGLQPLLAGQIERLPQPILAENVTNRDSNSPPLAMASASVKVLPASTSHPGIAWVTPLRSYPREMTGWELVALGRHPHTAWHGHLSEEDENQITAALQVCGATHLAHRSLAQMSDGERQRLCIARGIAQEARILLLDEPTAFLDAPGRMGVFRLAKKQAHQEKRAVILSTHDLDLALRGCDRILILRKKGQVMDGKPGDSAIVAEMKAEFEAEEFL